MLPSELSSPSQQIKLYSSLLGSRSIKVYICIVYCFLKCCPKFYLEHSYSGPEKRVKVFPVTQSCSRVTEHTTKQLHSQYTKLDQLNRWVPSILFTWKWIWRVRGAQKTPQHCPWSSALPIAVSEAQERIWPVLIFCTIWMFLKLSNQSPHHSLHKWLHWLFQAP